MFKKIVSLIKKDAGKQGDERDEQVAVCAILLEVAHADQNFQEEEREVIADLMKRRYGISDDEVDHLIDGTIAARDVTHDLWNFASNIINAFSPQQKLSMLTMVWRVIYADDYLDPNEEALALKLRDFLDVDHSVLLEARRRALPVHAQHRDKPPPEHSEA